MALDQTVAERVDQILLLSPGCSLDELVDQCSEFTWNQVFSEIDRRTRRGDVILKREGPSLYRLQLLSRRLER